MTDLRERALRRVPSRVRPVAELAWDTVADTFHDRVPGLAAEVAFWVLLSLPPLLLVVVSAVGLFGDATQDGFRDQLITIAEALLADSAVTDLEQVVDQVLTSARSGIIGFGLLLTVFSASRAWRVLTVAITIAYDLEDDRPAWKSNLVGIGLTVGALVVGVLVIPIFVAGPTLGEAIDRLLGLSDTFGPPWRIAYWPLATVGATALLTLLYHVAAPWWTPWLRDVPGAVLAMAWSLLGSVALRAYVATTIATDEIFAPLAAPLILLLWLYVMALGLLLGAELNAEIERRWPSEAYIGLTQRVRSFGEGFRGRHVSGGRPSRPSAAREVPAADTGPPGD